MAIELRPYQTRALIECLDAEMKGARVVALVAPTGAGKTKMGVWWSGKHGDGGVWLCHRKELRRQARKELDRAGLIRSAVMTVQSLSPNAPLPRAPWYVFDELHHYFGAPLWSAAVASARGGPALGLTATPERADGAALGALADVIVTGAQPRELIADGFLAPCEILAGQGATKHLTDHPVDAWFKHAQSRKTIVFCPSVKTAEEWSAGWREKGVAAACIHGQLEESVRERLLSDHAEGKLRVLTSVQVLTEGYDDPTVSCIIHARRYGSAGGWIQTNGRGVRASPGKKNCLVIDLHGSVYLWGTPDADRFYSLDGRAIRTGDGSEAVRQCKVCQKIFAASQFINGECPACGAMGEEKAPPRIVVEEIGRVSFGALSDDQHAFLRATREMAKSRGYKPGFVAWRFREKYGAWPPPDLGKSPAEVMADSTPEERRAFYARMVAIQHSKNYKQGWAGYRFKAKFGRWPTPGEKA
jgi:superfamily II DNA or RNA helicase